MMPRVNWKFALVTVLVLAGLYIATTNNESDGGSAAESGCVSVLRSTLDAIEEGLIVQGGGSLSNGRAKQGGDWWYVAAEINGPGLEKLGDVGVWAMPDPNDPGPIIMAEGFAREFSQWGTQTGAENLGVWQTLTAQAAAECV